MTNDELESFISASVQMQRSTQMILNALTRALLSIPSIDGEQLLADLRKELLYKESVAGSEIVSSALLEFLSVMAQHHADRG